MDSNTANVLERKKVFTKQKGLAPSELVWTPTYLAATVFVWDTNSNNDSDDFENVTKKKEVALPQA